MQNIFLESYDKNLKLQKRGQVEDFKAADKILSQFGESSKNTNKTDVDVMVKTVFYFISKSQKSENTLCVNILGQSKFRIFLEVKNKNENGTTIKIIRWLLFFSPIAIYYFFRETYVVENIFDFLFNLIPENTPELIDGIAIGAIKASPLILGFLFVWILNHFLNVYKKEYEIKNISDVRKIIRNFFEQDEIKFKEQFQSLPYEEVDDAWRRIG